MGVTQLWNILEPVKRQGDIRSLSSKTLCVDLSGWICEAQGSKGLKANVLKPHLRNLFFRVWNLTRVGVKLVFVVDGDAPEVKWEAIVKRNEARGAYGGFGRGRAIARGKGQRKKVGRSNFRIWVNECITLLKLLGIPFVESAGEAEALCAWMDAKGIVDGCITNDGDAFLYGARNVYKDLCISNKECSMDHYSMDDIEAKICLTREKLVSLAILLGCDYLPQGVPGVGKEMGLKLVHDLQDVDLLQRFQDWSSFGMCEDDMSRIEKSVKQKALKVAGFPNQEVINEFMSPKLKTKHLVIPKGNKCPDLKGLQEFCWKYLEWPEDYTKEKILPLVTYWQMERNTYTKPNNQGTVVTPERIVKARVQNKIECFEVLWNNNNIGDTCPCTFVTIETRLLFGQVYSVLVEEFEEIQKEKKVKKSGKKKGKQASADLQTGNDDAVEELCNNVDTLTLGAMGESVYDVSHGVNLYGSKKMAVLSEDEATEANLQVHQSGNLFLSHKKIALDLNCLPEQQQRQQKQHLQQQCKQKERKEKQHQEQDPEPQQIDAKFSRQNYSTLTGSKSDLPNARENYKLKVKKVEKPLEYDSSSEDETDDSFFCEFAVPLSRRLQGLCGTNKLHDSNAISRQFDRKLITTEENCFHEDFTNEHFKENNFKENTGGEDAVVVISSEDECLPKERDVDHGSLDTDSARPGDELKRINTFRDRTTSKDSSTREIRVKTNQDRGSGKDIEVTPLSEGKLSSEAKFEETKSEMAFKQPSSLIFRSKIPSSTKGVSSRVCTSLSDCAGSVMSRKFKDVQKCGKNFISHREVKPKVMQMVDFSSSESSDDDSWYVDDHSGVGGGVPAAADNDDFYLTRDNKKDNIPKNSEDKVASSNFVTEPYTLVSDINRLDSHLNSQTTLTNADLKSNKLKKKGYTKIFSKLNPRPTCLDKNVRQLNNNSKHKEFAEKWDGVCQQEVFENVSTPKLKDWETLKTEEKENIELPLEEIFVPLSLSERLGKHLHGRRNVLSTLRTLSTN